MKKKKRECNMHQGTRTLFEIFNFQNKNIIDLFIIFIGCIAN